MKLLFKLLIASFLAFSFIACSHLEDDDMSDHGTMGNPPMPRTSVKEPIRTTNPNAIDSIKVNIR